MVRLVVLEGWIKRVLNNLEGSEYADSFQVHKNSTYLDMDMKEERTAVIAMVVRNAGEYEMKWYGLLFDGGGRVLKYEVCDMHKHLPKEFWDELTLKFKEEETEKYVEWVIENAFPVIIGKGLMSGWLEMVR